MITKNFKWFSLVSVVIIVVGIICGIAFGGLNLGIDFTGGSITTIEMGGEFNADDVVKVLEENGVKNVPVIKAGEGYTKAVIRMQDVGDEAMQAETSVNILKGIQEIYPNATNDGVDRVGGVASAELVRNAVLAVIISCLLMLVYIWIRFELFSGIAAVVALMHDVLIMISIVCIVRLQINSAFIAACLTIVGYSINNTIVIFDRIRDNLKVVGLKTKSRNDIANISIKETLTRTINTSVTTLIMIVALYVFGVDSIKEFALPIIIGLLAGTYSSVFLSAPIWALLSDKFDKKKNLQNSKNSKSKSSKKVVKKTA
ncbi:MAG: protein translocase subunit SecF [Christensenellaceae bacterium]